MLDARDPLAYRCPEVEHFIRTADPNKKIVLLLNKIGEFAAVRQRAARLPMPLINTGGATPH